MGDVNEESEYVFAPENEDHWAVVEATGKKWNRLIIECLLANGSLRFNEFKREIGGISDKVLSDALSELEASGLVDRDVKPEKPIRVEYSLTGAGEGLRPVIEAVEQWVETYRM